MKSNEVVDIVTSIENKYDLYRLEMEGVPYWLHIRFALIEWLRQQAVGSESYLSRKKMDSINVFFLAIRTLFLKRIKQSDVLFITHQRRIKEGAYYKCIYTEDLADHFKASSVEAPYYFDHFTPIKNSRTSYIDHVLVIPEVKALFHRRLNTKVFRCIKESVSLELSDAIQEMEECLSVKMADRVFCSAVNAIMAGKYRKPLVARILSKAQPRLIVMPNAYSSINMIFCQLAHERNIPVVELMHGMINPAHQAYHYKCDYRLSALPDYFFSFAEYWHKFISYPHTRLIATGYPFFSEKLASRTLKDDNHNSEYKVTILFISSPEVGSTLSRIAVDLKRLVPDNYRIIYKLHPYEAIDWRKRCPVLIDSRIDVIDTQERDVYYFFSLSDIQVGYASTALYEGDAFGLDTFIYYSDDIADQMRDILEYKTDHFFTTAEELYHKIMNDEDNSSSMHDRQRFFKSNALMHIIEQIDQLLLSNAP